MSRIPVITPMPLQYASACFSHPDWLFELKHDGFRALAYVENGRCQLVSRKGNRFTHWNSLCTAVADVLGPRQAVLDGEIVCLDPTDGRSIFNDLLRRRAEPYFYAFDVLWLDGKDWRERPLAERKERLAKLLGAERGRIRYLDHIEEHGEAFYELICRNDCEGVVAKLKTGRYVSDRHRSTWLKIKNLEYSQREGRQDWFESRGA